ncbi:hypothetical protein [Streptomyces yangpuensis]|uniref:hypothetical protein n=1 Tax=Streptomyces yangpuensis TaxID=1648182 RepID=UPI00371C31B0
MSNEPVFVRHPRTRQYVYNPHNQVGRALIVIAPIVAIGVLYSLYTSWHWSEGELRTAVHQAADTLNARPRYANDATPQEGMIRDAVKETGAGPGHGLKIRGDGTVGYTIATEDTATAFCMRLTLIPVNPTSAYPAALERHHVTATVVEGACPQA